MLVLSKFQALLQDKRGQLAIGAALLAGPMVLMSSVMFDAHADYQLQASANVKMESAVQAALNSSTNAIEIDIVGDAVFVTTGS